MARTPAKTRRKRTAKRKSPAQALLAAHRAAHGLAGRTAARSAKAAAKAPAAVADGAGRGAGGGDGPETPDAGKGYGRGSKAVKAIGAAGPLALALGAMALPEAEPVRAPPERPPAVNRAAPPNAQPTAVPASRASAQCLGRYSGIGLPAHGASDVGVRQVLICRNSYVLSFNVDTRSPDWVVERISAAELTGSATRRDNFRSDPLAAGTDATNADYLRSGFDRGHQAPAGDAKSSQPAMDDSFFFTNMSPQVGVGFNRGAWKFLEENVRGWVMCGGHSELYVITGPIYGRNPSTIGANRVYVPREFFKIVYDPAGGRAVGFVMPNVRIGSTVDLQLYVRPIADIETDTGLDFFSTFDRRRQTLLESSPGTAWAHNGACPGDGGD